MEAQSLSTCGQCGKKFQRKAHLLRHQQQHSGDRPYSCKFCAKTFKRSDVLRDHFSRCDLRGTSEIPSSLERGRKRHACDECSRLKVKCDSEVPCRKCKEFGRTCIKSRTTAASSPTETKSHISPADAASDRNSIGFLLNCPAETDFIHKYPESSVLSSNNVAANFQKLEAVPNGFVPFGGDLTGVVVPGSHYLRNAWAESYLDVFLGNLELDTFMRRTDKGPLLPDAMILRSGFDYAFLDRSVLEQRAVDIREKLRYTAAARSMPNLPTEELLEAIGFITANTIATSTQLYFRHWHKHGPMVHEATYSPCKAAIPLVLALMSIGGMYSKDREHTQKLKLLLDTMEHYIYSIPGLNDDYDMPNRSFVTCGEASSSEWQQYQLEELQGAYLMIVVQYWTGNIAARRRVRQQRFTKVVTIIRHLEMPSMQHPPVFDLRDEQSYRTWIRTESYIRFASLAIMLDSAFGIFNNISPRFQWAEIGLTFPSDGRYFNTTNYEDLAAYTRSPPRKMKMKDAFKALFLPTERANENLRDLRSGNLTPLDMQILIHFLYRYTWSETYSNPMLAVRSTKIPQMVFPFKVALSNWKSIWDEIKGLAKESEWNHLGFQTMAENYYNATKAILQVFEQMEGKFPTLPCDCEKGGHLKMLLSI